jgi:voltage-gated potassium channel
MNVRKRTWEVVEGTQPGDAAGRVFAIFIVPLIFLNVLAVVAGSVQTVQVRFGRFLAAFEAASVAAFTAEYIVRLWASPADSRFQHPLWGRLRFVVQPMPIADFLAILPFYLPFCGVDLRSIRVLRLLRLVRMAKAGRYYSSLALIRRVFQSRKEELVLACALMGMLLVVSSSILFYCENEAQPELFSSIPAAMWWAVATLTTVGYGDVYPITAIGKLCASVISVLGIGMFALPTGILGAGFVEAVRNSRACPATCPHCGKEIR